MKPSPKADLFGLKFLELSEIQNPRRISPDRNAGRLTIENRAFHLERQLPGSSVLGVFEAHALLDSPGTGLHLVPYFGTGQGMRLVDGARSITDADAAALIREIAEREHSRFAHLIHEVGRRNSAADERRISDLINLGLDVLGKDGEKSVLASRRVGTNETRSASAGVTPSFTKQGKTATAKYLSSPTGAEGGGRESTPSIQPPTRTSTTSAEEVRKVLAGAGALDVVVLREAHVDEVNDALFELANQLELIGITRCVMDRQNTMEVLRRAAAAIKEVRIIKYVSDETMPDGVREIVLTPEGFWSYGLESLADRLEGAITDWLMIPVRDAKELLVQAENLRQYIRRQVWPATMGEHLGDASREVLDLFSGELAEGKGVISRSELREKVRGLLDRASERIGEGLPPWLNKGKDKKKKVDPNTPDACDAKAKPKQFEGVNAVAVQGKLLADKIKSKAASIMKQAKAATEQRIAEFNDCHDDKDGQFCATSGGDAKRKEGLQKSLKARENNPDFVKARLGRLKATAAAGEKLTRAGHREMSHHGYGMVNGKYVKITAAVKAASIAAHRAKDGQKSDRFQKFRQKAKSAIARTSDASAKRRAAAWEKKKAGYAAWGRNVAAELDRKNKG